MVRRKPRSGIKLSSKAIICSALTVLLAESRLNAHTILMDCVQHRVALTVGRANIDVDVELVFGEWQSLLQRRQMDRDGDDTISADERAIYERYLTATLFEPVSLLVDGRPLEVIPLYDPTVDLGGTSKTSLTGHRIRLSYFARTPSWLQSGSRIRVSDGLWVGQPALSFLNVSGRDGFRFTLENADSALSPWSTGAPRIMQVRCTTAADPVAPAAVAGVAGFALAGTTTPDVTPAAHPGVAGGGVRHSTGAILLLIATAVFGVLTIFRTFGPIRQGEQE